MITTSPPWPGDPGPTGLGRDRHERRGHPRQVRIPSTSVRSPVGPDPEAPTRSRPVRRDRRFHSGGRRHVAQAILQPGGVPMGAGSAQDQHPPAPGGAQSLSTSRPIWGGRAAAAPRWRAGHHLDGVRVRAQRDDDLTDPPPSATHPRRVAGRVSTACAGSRFTCCTAPSKSRMTA